MTYIITDETTQIKIVASNGLEWNIDKDDCLVLKVPAKTKDNTTTKDKLYIGNDGQWPLQLFYDEVTVDGNTPSDIDDFEDMVNAILQNNGSGGSADLEDTITRVQAVALLDNGGADIELGKTYFINDIGATIPELQFIKLTPAYGKDSGDTIKVFSPNAEAYITALATYVPCTYDVGTNKISCKYIAWAGTISQSGGSDATINETITNLIGETPVFDASSIGILEIQTTTWNWPQHKTILFSPHYFDGSNLWSPSLQWGSATSLTLYMVKGDGSLVDDMYVNQYIELSVIISNL